MRRANQCRDTYHTQTCTNIKSINQCPQYQGYCKKTCGYCTGRQICRIKLSLYNQKLGLLCDRSMQMVCTGFVGNIKALKCRKILMNFSLSLMQTEVLEKLPNKDSMYFIPSFKSVAKQRKIMFGTSGKWTDPIRFIEAVHSIKILYFSDSIYLV